MRRFWFCVLFGVGFLSASVLNVYAQVGKLKITCFPEALIFIDGQAALLGTTKKFEITVDAGPHTVTAEAPDYLMDEAKVDVYPDSRTTLHLSLVRADQDRSEMAAIPQGEYKIGLAAKRIKWVKKNIGGSEDDFKASVPKHTVKVKAFRIDKYEVTNKQYEKFIRAKNHKAPKGWRGDTYRRGQDDYPVVNVSWSDAAAYCKWKGKRLPTEAEWEIAAAGVKGLVFPWGRKFKQAYANTVEERFRSPTITGRYEKGVSKFDCYDMAGNVWEWTAGTYKPYPGSSLNMSEVEQNMRVVRGGSFKDKPFINTTVYRKGLKADGIFVNVGFRCAR